MLASDRFIRLSDLASGPNSNVATLELSSCLSSSAVPFSRRTTRAWQCYRTCDSLQDLVFCFVFHCSPARNVNHERATKRTTLHSTVLKREEGRLRRNRNLQAYLQSLFGSFSRACGRLSLFRVKKKLHLTPLRTFSSTCSWQRTNLMHKLQHRQRSF